MVLDFAVIPPNSRKCQTIRERGSTAGQVPNRAAMIEELKTGRAKFLTRQGF